MSGFNPDEYLKAKLPGGFDPDTYLQRKAPSSIGEKIPISFDDPPTEIDSAARGAAQGLTMGFRDEGAGALKSPSGALKEIANKFGAEFSDEDIEAYKRERDESRRLDHVARAANPKSFLAGELGGAVATSFLPGLGALNAAKGAGTAATVGKAALQGGISGLGMSDAEGLKDIALDTGKGTVIGGGAGAAGTMLSKIPVGKILTRSADIADDVAERLALSATGATGKQSEKFAEGAGRELLDRGLVRFGDSAGDIAGRTGAAMDEAEAVIAKSLAELDSNGVTASADNVVAQLEEQIKKLKKNSSQAGTVRKLQGIINDIIETGESNISVSLAEETKRGFRKAAGNWMDPEAGAAGKQAYLGYMDEVEQAATKADPSIAGQFKDAKETYGLLAPIEEAASNRAATLNQSPIGGMGDIVATGVAGIPGAIARRLGAPRLASSAAVTADKIAEIVRASPQMLGRFAAPLQAAASRGGTSLAATHFVLQQTQPEYREIFAKEH